MHSYFVFTKQVNNLLFKDFNCSSIGGIIGMCCLMGFFTITYEAIKYYRHHLASVSRQASQQYLASTSGSVDAESPKTERSPLVRKKWFGPDTLFWIKFHIAQTFLHILQVVFAYIVMLSIMSFNAWLALAVFFSSGLSYYIFGILMTSKPLVVPVEMNSSH